MNKELDYFDMAGILQAKSYQFNALGLNEAHSCFGEVLALRYIENLIDDLEGYKELLKKKITEREEQEKEERLRAKYEEGWR